MNSSNLAITPQALAQNLPKALRRQMEKRISEEQQGTRARTLELRLSQRLTQEQLFRFSYIPFVICAVAWDWADSCINLGQLVGHTSPQPVRRRLNRAKHTIRALKRQYDQYRSRFLESSHFQQEDDNMLLFQDDLARYFTNILHCISNELTCQHPSLDTDTRFMVEAAYVGRIVLDSVFAYSRQQSSLVGSIIGRPVADILCTEMYQLHTALGLYIGAYSLTTETWSAHQKQMVAELLSYIHDIQLFFTEEQQPSVINS